MDQAGTNYTSTWPDGVKVTAVVIDDDNVQEMVEFPKGHPAGAHLRALEPRSLTGTERLVLSLRTGRVPG